MDESPIQAAARATSDLEAISSLADPTRRALYELVASSKDPVSRDEAAAAIGVSRPVAAYHLDRLVEDGLAEVEFRRLSGRVGPGAGRTSKLYRKTAQEYEVSVPPRRYELAARIMLEAIGESDLDFDLLAGVAHRVGSDLGRSGLNEALAATGYESATENGETRFRNCPFHVLREQDRAITCRLNLALVEGMVEGAGSEDNAVLAPEDGYCCVRLRPRG
ncbi:MAG: helix-turn-helix transcriptional regulator [Acidimicrobiia bacterium]